MAESLVPRLPPPSPPGWQPPLLVICISMLYTTSVWGNRIPGRARRWSNWSKHRDRGGGATRTTEGPVQLARAQCPYHWWRPRHRLRDRGSHDRSWGAGDAQRSRRRCARRGGREPGDRQHGGGRVLQGGRLRVGADKSARRPHRRRARLVGRPGEQRRLLRAHTAEHP